MTIDEKIAKAESKLLKVQAKLSQLRLQKQNECDHVYMLTGSYNDDDGFSRRMCTQVTNYTCVLCGHGHTTKHNFLA